MILNFWATYCIPCRKEMPDLAAIQNEFARVRRAGHWRLDRRAEDRDKVLQFVKETKINFPIWLGGSTAAHDEIRLGRGTAWNSRNRSGTGES